MPTNDLEARGAVDLAIDGALVLSLRSAILFPTSLVPKKDVVVSGRQSMRTSLSSDFEGNAIIFEDFPGCTGCAIGPPLACCSWVSKASAILPPANPWNRFLAMPVKLDHSSFSAFNQLDKNVTIEFPAFQDNQQVATF